MIMLMADIGISLFDATLGDCLQIELADTHDTKQEKEQEKEEKIRARVNLLVINVASTKNRVEEGMLSSVDLQSLFHPEIITPPPELG